MPKKSAPPRVFISYARKDGATLAARLQKDLSAGGFDAWLDKNRLKGGASWTNEIEAALDEANSVLALLTPGSYVSEICRAEQLRALRKGKCVIPLLAQRGADIPLHLEAKNYRDFTNAATYKKTFSALCGDIQAGRGIIFKPQFRQTYVTVPPLPINYVNRPEELAALRNALISDDAGQHIGLTALQGMGGIGKTVLAQALCRDEVVQQAFPDGIVWLTIGRETTVPAISQLREIGKALGDDLSLYDSDLAAKNQYRSTIRGKAALVVIDDIWQTRDLEPFLAEDSPRSRLLFTTRDANIAAAVGARPHVAGLLNREQSRAVLARWSGAEVAKLPPIADELIRECGALPLALSMTGAMLRAKPAALWDRVYNLLRNADLEKIKAQFPGYPYTDVLRAIQVSVDALDALTRERYLALAVLPEDMPAIASLQRHLWAASEGEALETTEQLVALSLAQRDQAEGSIRLHDLQLDYIRKQYSEQEVLPLLQGAIRLASNIIAKDPAQFTSQMVGRLLPHQALPAVARFVKKVVETTKIPWLRPLQPTLHPAGAALVRTLEGHVESVNRVALSYDGRAAVSASDDGTIKVWDLENGRELHSLSGHTKSVEAVALSGDKHIVVSASDDQTLKVWNLNSGNLLGTLKGHTHYVRGLALSSDGQVAISASADDTFRVWDVANSRKLRILKADPNAPSLVAISADGKTALSVSNDSQLKLWEVLSGREIKRLQKKAITITALALSADGRTAISCSRAESHDNYNLTVWDAATGRERRSFSAATQGHNGIVWDIALSADARTIAVPQGTTIRVWETSTGRDLGTFRGHSDDVNGVALSGDGSVLISASRDHTLKVWSIGSGQVLQSLQAHADTVNAVAASTDGRIAVSASADGTLKIWDAPTVPERRTINCHYDPVKAVALTANGETAMSLTRDDEAVNFITLWDTATGKEQPRVEGHFEDVRAIAISRDGGSAASCEGYALLVWDVPSGRQRHFIVDNASLFDLALSGDGHTAVTLQPDNTLQIWDIVKGEKLKALGESSETEARGFRLAINSDSSVALSGLEDGTLTLWDLAKGEKLTTMNGHTAMIKGLAINSDGSRALSASEDNSVEVWDLATLAPIAAFTCDGSATCCAFAGDSGVILVGDAGGHVHFLQLEQP